MAARGHATVDAGVIEQKASILTLTLPRSRIAPGRPGGSPFVDFSTHRHPIGSPARKQSLYGLLWAQFRRDQRQNRLSILRACLRYELLSEMQGNTYFLCNKKGSSISRPQ